MKYCFLGVAFFLFSSLFALPDVSPNWTHSIEAADFQGKVILLNDGSRWELIEGFEEGLVTEISRSKKKIMETISHKKGYPLLEKDLWEKGKQLRITPVYLDANGFIIQPSYFARLNKTPYFMFEFFVGEVKSSIQPETYIPRYRTQGPFVAR